MEEEPLADYEMVLRQVCTCMDLYRFYGFIPDEDIVKAFKSCPAFCSDCVRIPTLDNALAREGIIDIIEEFLNRSSHLLDVYTLDRDGLLLDFYEEYYPNVAIRFVFSRKQELYRKMYGFEIL